MASLIGDRGHDHALVEGQQYLDAWPVSALIAP
jgi:hypothetical protein